MRWLAPRDVVGLGSAGLMALTGLLPWPGLQAAVARRVGDAAFRLSRRKRRRIEASLAGCFGREMPKGERRRLTREVFRETWREVLDAPRADALRRQDSTVEIHGLENLEAARAAGRGAILWESQGLGRRLRSKSVLRGLGFSICQVHAASHLGGVGVDERGISWVGRRLVRPVFDRVELRHVEEIVEIPDDASLAYTRLLLERLRRNALLCVAGDGRLGRRTVEVPFLGGSARFATGMVSLARLAGAPLLPLFCVALPSGALELTIEAPVSSAADGGRDAEGEVIRHYAAQLDARIRRSPGQYRSWHRRGAAASEPAR